MAENRFCRAKDEMPVMSRPKTPFVTALAVLFLGSPLIAGCGFQSKIMEQLSHLGGDKIARYTKAIEINPKDAEAYSNRSLAKYEI